MAPDRGTAVHDGGPTSTAQDKNALDKEDVPRDGDCINSGSKRADLIGAGCRANPPA
jgi:hypothetical protein